jgi:hypothetical protein
MVRGWWLFRAMAGGEHEDRVELERGESVRAQRAWRAFAEVQSILRQGGEDAVGLILGLLDAATGHAEVAVGPGPLEDLISEHGDNLVDLIDRTARQRPDFAASLQSVSLEAGTLRTETMDRLSRWVHAG